jgi:hypothetical protein
MCIPRGVIPGLYLSLHVTGWLLTVLLMHCLMAVESCEQPCLMAYLGDGGGGGVCMPMEVGGQG